jgi:hypothetical protein
MTAEIGGLFVDVGICATGSFRSYRARLVPCSHGRFQIAILPGYIPTNQTTPESIGDDTARNWMKSYYQGQNISARGGQSGFAAC